MCHVLLECDPGTRIPKPNLPISACPLRRLQESMAIIWVMMLSSGSTRSMQVWNKTKSIKELTPALLVSFGFWWQPGFSSFQTNCCKLPAKNNTEDMSPIPKTSPAPLPLGVTFMVDHLLSIWASSPLQLFGHKFTKSFHNIQENQILNLKKKSIYQARWDSSLMQHKKQPKKQGFTPVRPWRQVRSSWSPRCGGSQLMGGMRIPKIPIGFALVLESLSHLTEISRPSFFLMYSFRRNHVASSRK